MLLLLQVHKTLGMFDALLTLHTQVGTVTSSLKGAAAGVGSVSGLPMCGA
jgi:hypothetical protein